VAIDLKSEVGRGITLKAGTLALIFGLGVALGLNFIRTEKSANAPQKK
jgi:hypothetical protein